MIEKIVIRMNNKGNFVNCGVISCSTKAHLTNRRIDREHTTDIFRKRSGKKIIIDYVFNKC